MPLGLDNGFPKLLWVATGDVGILCVCILVGFNVEVDTTAVYRQFHIVWKQNHETEIRV